MLEEMLQEVMKIDATKGGMFSEPVPKDQFPDYYKVVKTPMDYGSMKLKLTNGEYRSAQQMQRDFLLVMQNCIKYNAPDSDIVREARRQALSMPGLLRDVCMKNHLFLAEDGAVLDIVSDSEEKERKGVEIKVKRGRKKVSKGRMKEEGEDAASPMRKNRKRKAGVDEGVEEINNGAKPLSDDDATDENNVEPKTKKPRIRISLPKTKASTAGKVSKEDDDDDDDQPVSSLAKGDQSKRKRSKQQRSLLSDDHLVVTGEEYSSAKKKGKKKKLGHEADVEDKVHLGTPVPRKKVKKIDMTEDKTKDKEESEPEDGEVRESVEQSDQDKRELVGPATAHLDKAKIKRKFEALDGSFQEARAFFTERGPWVLPPIVQVEKDKEVAKILLSKMKKLDQYSLFAKPVTEAEAPGYFKVIKNPMDFRTIKEKIEQNEYGKGSDLVRGLYFDILLVMDNCALYNEENSDVAQEAARILALLPETFASACIAVSTIGSAKISKKKKP